MALVLLASGQSETGPTPIVTTLQPNPHLVLWPHRWSGKSTVGYRVVVGPDGRVSGCEILQSSGHHGLDHSTCGQLLRRARFNPALNGAGEPVAGEWFGLVSYTEDDEPSDPPPEPKLAERHR